MLPFPLPLPPVAGVNAALAAVVVVVVVAGALTVILSGLIAGGDVVLVTVLVLEVEVVVVLAGGEGVVFAIGAHALAPPVSAVKQGLQGLVAPGEYEPFAHQVHDPIVELNPNPGALRERKIVVLGISIEKEREKNTITIFF